MQGPQDQEQVDPAILATWGTVEEAFSCFASSAEGYISKEELLGMMHEVRGFRACRKKSGGAGRAAAPPLAAACVDGSVCRGGNNGGCSGAAPAQHAARPTAASSARRRVPPTACATRLAALAGTPSAPSRSAGLLSWTGRATAAFLFWR